MNVIDSKENVHRKIENVGENRLQKCCEGVCV